MNWWKRKPKDVIPNPRDKKRKQGEFDTIQRGVLMTLQFYVFVMALILLVLVSQ